MDSEAAKSKWKWILWTPEKAEEPDGWVFEDIARAMGDFRPVDNDFGRLAADWLKTEALNSYPTIETWLLYDPPRIEGFLSICKTSLIATGLTAIPRRRRMPACEINWVCKHADSGERTGRDLLDMATYAAALMWRKRELTLLLDTKGADTTKLRQKHVFWEVASQPDRLWTPLSFRPGEEPWNLD
jgi:hypothetical protein